VNHRKEVRKAAAASDAAAASLTPLTERIDALKSQGNQSCVAGDYEGATKLFASAVFDRYSVVVETPDSDAPRHP
jgi:hypothetical protein